MLKQRHLLGSSGVAELCRAAVYRLVLLCQQYMMEKALWELLRLDDMRAEALIQERWQANAHCTYPVQQDNNESTSCVGIYMQGPRMIYELRRSQQQEPEN